MRPVAAMVAAAMVTAAIAAMAATEATAAAAMAAGDGEGENTKNSGRARPLHGVPSYGRSTCTSAED